MYVDLEEFISSVTKLTVTNWYSSIKRKKTILMWSLWSVEFCFALLNQFESQNWNFFIVFIVLKRFYLCENDDALKL